MEQVKAWIFNIQHYSLWDGPGIRTTVFLKGCPLRCRWCCNPESQEAGAAEGEKIEFLREMTIEEVLTEVEKDEIFYRHGAGGMTVSGGEPLAQGEFTVPLLKEAKRHYLTTAIETSGFVSSEVLLEAAQYLDTIFFDIKCIDNAKHKQWTGVSNDRILDNLKKLVEKPGTTAEIVVRTPVIPGFNDTKEDIAAILGFLDSIGQKRYELLRYHRYGKGKYEKLGRTYPMGDVALSEEKWQELSKMAAQWS